MNATISTGTPYFIESSSGELVPGGTFASDTVVEAVNVTGKTFNVYSLNGQLIFVKVGDDR
jgi:hypothetical protein